MVESLRGAVQKNTFLADMSAREKIENAWNALKLKNFLKTFSTIFVRVSAKTIFY